MRSHRKKLDVARLIRKIGFPLTLNVVIHRLNIAEVPELIALALELGADRLELANTQFYAWAAENRRALMPTREDYDRAEEIAREAIAKYRGTLEIAFVQNDYLSGEPKPCMGGWGRSYMCINPTGEVMPCHAAAVIPGLRFESIRDNSLEKIWRDSPAMNAFRGDDWMMEPCRSCAQEKNRFRWMPMPGLHAGGKCRRGRSDLPPLTASWDRRIDAQRFCRRRSADLSRHKDQPCASASLAP